MDHVRNRPLLWYFVLAFGGTWLVFAPAVLARGFRLFGLPDAVVLVLFGLATFTGPFAAAISVTATASGRSGVRELLAGVVRNRAPRWWYLMVLLGYPLVTLIAVAPLVSSSAFDGIWSRLPVIVTAYVPALIFNLIMPALGEETGWRGFSLPRLQWSQGPLKGSLILGGLHALWHLPAYLVPGFMQSGGFDLGFFLWNSGAIVAAAVIWTWLYNLAGGSIFPAMVVHAASNASPALVRGLVGPIHSTPWLGLVLFGAIAGTVTLATGGNLGHRGERRVGRRARTGLGAHMVRQRARTSVDQPILRPLLR
jgi:membrane protease YdiL (CAAX protease family)